MNTAMHGIRYEYTMDLRRDRKRSLKLCEMEEAQEEDRKGKEKSGRKDSMEDKRQQNTLAQKR